MNRANLLTAVWLSVAAIGYCQISHSPFGAYAFTTGAYSREFQDAFSIHANIGALSTVEDFSVAVYGERRFMLQATGFYTAIATLPTATGNFAVQADHSGYSNYSESQLGLGYGLALNKNLGIGAKFNYYHLRIPSYHSASAVTFELGSVLRISDQLFTGVSVYNPFRSPLGKNTGERIASVYKAGIGYQWSPLFLTQLEVIKESDQVTNIHLGIQYKPIDQVWVRAGVQTDPGSVYFGVGYLYLDFRMDLSVSLHQQLGATPGLQLAYMIKKKKE